MNSQTALALRTCEPATVGIAKPVDYHDAIESETATYYEFREVTDANELEQIFRLRYRVYRACDLRHFVPENEYGLDLDAYDLRSHHYGLFHCENGQSRVIGCVRVVTDRETDAAPAIRLIAKFHRRFEPVIAKRPPEVFPMLEYVPFKEQITKLIQSSQRKGLSAVESGRLVIDPGHQFQLLGRKLILAAAAASFGYYGYDQVLAFTYRVALRFYQHAGFRIVPGTGQFLGQGVSSRMCHCFCARSTDIFPADQTLYRRYATELRATGRARIEVEQNPKSESRATATKPAEVHYEFREVTDTAGLEQLFRLRYRCFRGSKLAGLIANNDSELDIDSYDLRSRHFGLFECTGSGERLVGNHRHVYDCEQPAAEAIRALVAKQPELRDRVLAVPEHPYPVLSYWPDKEPIYALHREACARGETLIEASRLALDPSVESLAVVNFMFEATVASYQALGGTRALTVINSNRKRYYSRYGFTTASALPDRFIPSAQTEGSVLIWDSELTNDLLNQRIASRKSEYQEKRVLRLEGKHQAERSTGNE